MRRTLGSLAAAAAVLLLGATALAETEPAEGQPLPAFELEGADGSTHSFESLRGDRGLVLVVYRGVW